MEIPIIPFAFPFVLCGGRQFDPARSGPHAFASGGARERRQADPQLARQHAALREPLLGRVVLPGVDSTLIIPGFIRASMEIPDCRRSSARMIGGTRCGRPVFRLQALAAERHVVYLGDPRNAIVQHIPMDILQPRGGRYRGQYRCEAGILARSAPHVEPFAPENGLVTILTRDGCFMAFVT